MARPKDDGSGSASVAPTQLHPGCQLAREADPAELASLIRAFLAGGGGGRRASGIGAQCAAAGRLHDIAYRSVADALAVVSAEGLLRRVERNLAERAAAGRLELAHFSISIVAGAVVSNDAAVCARIAEERDLLRVLVLLVARGPRASGDGSRGALKAAIGTRSAASDTLMRVASSAAAPGEACACVVDALTDEDLKSLVDVSVDREQDDALTSGVIGLLACCLGHAPLRVRLVGPVGLPLALAKLLAGKGSPDSARNAVECLQRLIEAAQRDGPPLAGWAKPIVKPLRSAFARSARGSALGSTPLRVGSVLATLACDPLLIPTVASGMPDFVSLVQGGGPPSFCAANIIRNMVASHPAAQAAALREGAVPALVSLLYGRDGAPSPAVAALEGEKVAIVAFSTLGIMSVFDDLRAALLAMDAASRLRGTLLGASMAGLRLSPGDQDILGQTMLKASIMAINAFITFEVLPVAALVDTGALKRTEQLSRSGDVTTALRAAKLLLASLKAARPPDVKPVIDAIKTALHSFSPAGVHGYAAPQITARLADCFFCQTRQSHEPYVTEGRPDEDILSRWLPERGQALGELLVADAHVILRLCSVVQARPGDAFDADLGGLDAGEVRCEPFCAGRILHYLDCHAGPAVAARLTALAHESVLSPVRVAAARGRWGCPRGAPPGALASGGGGERGAAGARRRIAM